MNISFSNLVVMTLASLQVSNVSARLTGTSNGFITFPTTPDFHNPASSNQNTVYGNGGYTIKSIFPGNLPFSLAAVNANANGCALAITNSDCPTSLKLNQECHFDVAVLYPNGWDSALGVINGYIDVECQAQGNYKSYFSIDVDVVPTFGPSEAPTVAVSIEPTSSPEASVEPSTLPSMAPSAAGTLSPTIVVSNKPSVAGSSMSPSAVISSSPSAAGTVMPTIVESLSPTENSDGSVEPSITPTAPPSGVNAGEGFCHEADFTCIAVCSGIALAIAGVAAVGYVAYLQRQRDAKSGIYEPLNGAAVGKNSACCWPTKPSYINHVG